MKGCLSNQKKAVHLFVMIKLSNVFHMFQNKNHCVFAFFQFILFILWSIFNFLLRFSYNTGIVWPKWGCMILWTVLYYVHGRNFQRLSNIHYVKSICIRSFSGLYFSAFGLNTESYSSSLCISSECGKIWTRKAPETDTFHAVISSFVLAFFHNELSLSLIYMITFKVKVFLDICLFRQISRL